MNSDIPVGKFAIVQAEVSTGILLNLDGTRRLNNEGEYLLIFDTYKSALSRAEAIVVENPEIECSLRNDEGSHIQFVRNEKYKHM